MLKIFLGTIVIITFIILIILIFLSANEQNKKLNEKTPEDIKFNSLWLETLEAQNKLQKCVKDAIIKDNVLHLYVKSVFFDEMKNEAEEAQREMENSINQYNEILKNLKEYWAKHYNEIIYYNTPPERMFLPGNEVVKKVYKNIFKI